MVDRPRNKRALKSAFNNVLDETTGRSGRDYGTDLWVGFRKACEYGREAKRLSPFHGADFQHTARKAAIPSSCRCSAKHAGYACRSGEHTAPTVRALHAP